MPEELSLVEPGDPLQVWFALRVRSNFEGVAVQHLRSRGVEEFAPTFTTQRQWSDRKKQIEQYLFPGYVFCRLNPNERLPVLTIPGAVGLVSFGKGPCQIPDSEIESVRTLAGSGALVGPWPYLQAGQTVLIEHGPLAGVEGILLPIKKKFRLVVSISLLERSVSAEVERSWIRPVRRTNRGSEPSAPAQPNYGGGNPVVKLAFSSGRQIL